MLVIISKKLDKTFNLPGVPLLVIPIPVAMVNVYYHVHPIIVASVHPLVGNRNGLRLLPLLSSPTDKLELVVVVITPNSPDSVLNPKPVAVL